MSQQQQSSMIIPGTNLNTNKHVAFAKPRINKSGGKAVAVLEAGAGNKWLHISTPLMLTWGVNEFVDDGSGRRSYDMSLQFPKEGYETEATTKFLTAITAFQDKLKATAVENARAWFGKQKMSAEVIDALFHPMLRYPKDQATGEPDQSRAPTLRVKLDFWDEAFNCEIYDIQQGAGGAHKRLFPDEGGSMEGPGPMDLITKGSNVACVLKCGGLWFANGKFGCTWKLMQAIVKPKASMRGKCMIQLSASETATLAGQDNGEDEAEEGTGAEAASVVVEDSDEEEEEEIAKPSFTPEPPAPAPVKKVAKKVKKRVVRKSSAAQ